MHKKNNYGNKRESGGRDSNSCTDTQHVAAALAKHISWPNKVSISTISAWNQFFNLVAYGGGARSPADLLVIKQESAATVEKMRDCFHFQHKRRDFSFTARFKSGDKMSNTQNT